MVAARASQAAEPSATVAAVRLEVEAAASCATRDELAARVAARSARIRFIDDADGGTALRAEIGPGPNDTVIGRLSIVDPSGPHSSRRLSAPTCAEAVDAIALIIVISLDPTYAPPATVPSERGPPPATPGSRGAATSDGGRRALTAPPSAEPGAPDREPSTEPPEVSKRRSRDRTTYPTEVPTEVPAEVPAARPAVRRLGIGAAAQLISGPAPRVMPGVAVRIFAALDRDSIWSPVLRLTGSHAWRGGLAEPGGTAAFSLDTLGVDLCVLRLAIQIVDLRGCGSGSAGRLSATGSNTYSPNGRDRPFIGLGGAAIIDLALGPLFQLSATMGASDALIRDTFEFSPQVFHRVAATILTADLGLQVRFP
jgi:hypothetical protein